MSPFCQRDQVHTRQAVKRYRLGSVDLGTVDPSAAQRSRKSLPAIPVPTLPTITMPTLSPNFTGQVPCQAQKIFCWGLLSPPSSQYVRGQEISEQYQPVTMQDHYIKTSFPASELGCSLMEIDSRTIKYNHYNRLDTIYSSVCHNYRRTLSKWT